jgi:tryptophan synthase alpha chain
MSRISARYAALREAGRTALVPFVTAGDPQPAATVPMMHALVEAGADLLELGVPFSDPMADGPVIQRASERALAHGVSLRDVLDYVAEFRRQDPSTPVVLMGYLNPIEVMGYREFARAAQAAGVDGVLTVDLPPEEAHPLVEALQAGELDPIFLIAPTSTAERIARIGELASGFVYYVSIKGVTGAGGLDSGAIAAKLAEVRKRIPLPVGVGFGIKDAATAAEVAKIADAVIVGSALVSRIEALAAQNRPATEPLAAFLATLREAIDR